MKTVETELSIVCPYDDCEGTIDSVMQLTSKQLIVSIKQTVETCPACNRLVIFKAEAIIKASGVQVVGE